MVAVMGDGVKGEGRRSEGCNTRQPTQTDRPFIHYWASVWSSSPMSLASPGELTVTISHLSSEQLITTMQLQILRYEAQYGWRSEG
jgi:hypothetical protein